MKQKKTNLYRILCTSFLILVLTKSSLGQANTNFPKVNPVTPDAAALFKVLERPIGTYTGTIPISFPLMSLSSGTVSTSLSLDYNSTGGIKVEEISGGVGLGFSLSDGGGTDCSDG